MPPGWRVAHERADLHNTLMDHLGVPNALPLGVRGVGACLAGVAAAALILATLTGSGPAAAERRPAAPPLPLPPISAAASLPPGVPPICYAPWFRPGARAQLEADGKMPMSITMTVRYPRATEDGCEAWFDIHSKSALAAMMGPPVVMDQMHRLNIVGQSGSPDGWITSRRATINAQARYSRLFGEVSFEGSGMVTYTGHDIREGATLPGETISSSAAFEVHSLHSGEAVTTIRVPRALVVITERQVGNRQWIDTALGRRECLPIRFQKHTSLGLVYIGDDIERPEPYLMAVTDWYCPSEAFVLRSEVRQDDELQVIDTTAIGIPDDAR